MAGVRDRKMMWRKCRYCHRDYMGTTPGMCYTCEMKRREAKKAPKKKKKSGAWDALKQDAKKHKSFWKELTAKPKKRRGRRKKKSGFWAKMRTT